MLQVYNRVWVPVAREGEPMRVIYRMRGLLGDATEEFVETLDKKDKKDEDEEQIYRMAGVMADCGGLEVMLDRLGAVHDVQYARPLLAVLLKLFSYCIKVSFAIGTIGIL